MRRHAVIIGAGLGGLASAVRLALAGWRVTVLEKNDQVGGRCNRFHEGGFTFDTGPTLLLMRDVLDDLFAVAGRRLDEYFDLVRVSPNYRVHFADGSGITLSGRLDEVEVDVEAIEPGAARAFRAYLADAAYKYAVARERFVERNFEHWYRFATAPNLYYLWRTNTLRKLESHARRYFRDPRLISAFTFQTMYLGLAPGDAPAVYSLLPYTEMVEGVWYPRGGMYRVAEATARLAEELGVRIETGSEAESLLNTGRFAHGVRLTDGRVVAADVVLSNADLPYSYDRLIRPSRRGRFTPRSLRRLDYGSSAFLLYLGVDRSYEQLNHHGVYLSSDPRDNFDAIFRRHELPADPSFYVCAPSRTDDTVAPPGQEAIYVLVPVPRLSPGVSWSRQRDPFKDMMYGRLEASGLHDLRRHVVVERTYTPEDFARDYNLAHGSAFGLSHRFDQVGYFRPANRARDLTNVYFVGASTVPGGGVPMVVIGSRLVTERIVGDWGHG